MRTYEHVIDTKALKNTLKSIPDHWVVRDLSERDYGIDLMMEIFSKSGVDRHGHPIYEATGRNCYLQVKGVNKELTFNRNKTVSFGVDKKALLYVEKFATPFILVRVCTLEKKEAVYYVWLQRYILEVLDKKTPDWRDGEQGSFAVQIPITNKLPDNPAKIEKIAGRITFVEEQAEFYEKYTLMKPGFHNMISGKFTSKLFDAFINDLKRIKNLSSLLDLNDCQVNQDDIGKLIKFVMEVKRGKPKLKSKSDFPKPIASILYNLDMLVNDNFMRMALEGLVAENEQDTVY